MRIALAASDAEREAVYRLRYRHVVEAGWASPARMPDGMEHDSFDDWATHVTAWEGEELVGTCRVVFPDGDRALPAEAAFDLVIEPRGRAPTIDRLLVDSRHRGDGVTLAVLGKAWAELSRRGFEAASGVATESSIELFRRMGIEVTVLAGPRVYWGEPRYAILAVPTPALVASAS